MGRRTAPRRVVRAAALHPGRRLRRPGRGREGADAGFDDGTPVYGYPRLTGCCAEYLRCPVERLALIPAGLTAVEAAAVAIDGLTPECGLADILHTSRPGTRS